MNHYFPHEQLDVYGVALRFASLAEDLLASWPPFWAVYGQFDRAIESVVTNLAKAARLKGSDAGVYSLECSLGSVLECAASLDVASIRNLVDASRLHAAKESLQQIARMEVGLRRSWESCVHEQPDAYATSSGMYFFHESLRVYQRSLQVHEGLNGLWKSDQIRSRHVKRVDDLTTSLTLNIAEGNGRFSKVDHRKFIGIAEDAGTKLAAYMDLLAPMALVDVDQVKAYLREVMAMLSGLRGYLDG